ncbi:type II toxin-antitoxin system VapC family toxin [Treponema putidum]|uniref:Type II toxin-antitoxin system VapC family toxin n=1 Tax=Treponema putidum TaxID=221027 RepID=A0AAE9MTT7_9SPIR|nr:type II toxin-antitoxin system VapC family toxin [Treponema putidum]AIN93428.1 twitching motility protein PilT [Treponema putidum]TWI74500.1 PIN domain nuclease of toxin-antitoxin system [Treponema putidum]UTY29670.1 type II toxin-antitoxin system VapC family toxin [Treponema putidum]UTY32140.1 type II toxin-antitoxin system VapC family toxin [Treponema putidum]UTY34529.1 type II toxin-antitoxin system VapC family toxin [Treponema putidum]
MYLLDTHTLLWFLRASPQLSKKALEIITTENKVYVSIVSLWEIAIKKSIGKLEFEYSIEKIAELCHEKDILILQIQPKYFDKIIKLANIHNDPFDRLIIAQAIIENLVIITKDTIIPKYSVKTLW